MQPQVLWCGYLNKQHDFWVPVETRFQKPLWAAWCVRWSLPSTRHHPSHRRPPSRIGCHPEEQRRAQMRHAEVKHMRFTQRWRDLRPVCVWRIRSETSPCGTSSRCSPECLQVETESQSSPPSCFFTHLLPSFLSLSGSDLDEITDTRSHHEDHRWQTGLNLPFPPVPSSMVFLDI